MFMLEHLPICFELEVGVWLWMFGVNDVTKVGDV
jgi:hypothetical protein